MRCLFAFMPGLGSNASLGEEPVLVNSERAGENSLRVGEKEGVLNSPLVLLKLSVISRIEQF